MLVLLCPNMFEKLSHKPCCAKGSPLSSSLLPKRSFSFPVSAGLHQRARFFTQPALGLSCKTSSLHSAGELLHEGTRVNWKQGSAYELVCRFWLDAKTGRFPFSGAEKHTAVCWKDWHTLSGVCHCTICWGVSQTIKKKKTRTKQTEPSDRDISFSILRCFTFKSLFFSSLFHFTLLEKKQQLQSLCERNHTFNQPHRVLKHNFFCLNLNQDFASDHVRILANACLYVLLPVLWFVFGCLLLLCTVIWAVWST